MFLEWQAAQTHKLLPDAPPDQVRSLEDEVRLDCLETCMETSLEPHERKLILAYYEGEKGIKIKSRKSMATQLNTSTNALRIECHRIRRRLQGCVMDCVKRKRIDGSAH